VAAVCTPLALLRELEQKERRAVGRTGGPPGRTYQTSLLCGDLLHAAMKQRDPLVYYVHIEEGKPREF
jgi:hypothetical protein